MTAKKKFRITRDCCTRGNCMDCMDLPFGNKTRVVQLDTDIEERAHSCVFRFRAYNAKLVVME